MRFNKGPVTGTVLALLGLAAAVVLMAWNHQQDLKVAGVITVLLAKATKQTPSAKQTPKPSVKLNPRFAAMMAKARKLENQAEVWMNHGKIRGGDVQLPTANKKPGTILCDASAASTDDPDSHFMERELGCDGNIPPSVAKSWRKEIQDVNAATTPAGTFYDSTNSQIWSGAYAKQWDPVEHDGQEGGGHVKKFGPNNEDWLNPKRWVAERKLDWVAQAALGDNQLSSEPYTKEGQGVIATPMDETLENGAPIDWERLMREVSDRYDHPLDSK
jgi:hypothetical protein